MRAAVLGSPIAHSLSPRLHRAAYEALGLSWSYDAVLCDAASLPAFVAGLDASWAGLSLTMPLKEAVLPLLASVTPLAASVAAANTVLVREDGLHGDNTDVHGIVAALGSVGITQLDRAVVLGGGATARSTLAALGRLGCTAPVVVVRSPSVQTRQCAARLGLDASFVTWDPAVLTGASLVVSTLPSGAADRLAPCAADVPALLDVVYDPWPTALAAACRGVVVSGQEMLLHQAARQVELMTGLEAPVERMRAALPA